MRELERNASDDVPSDCLGDATVAIIGRGRLGTALAAALREAGITVTGPHGREADGEGADIVLLCVPDGEIAGAARHVRPGALVGHCSGATDLEPLSGHEGFSLHPLMTVPETGARFTGAGAAVDGTSERAIGTAEALARRLGMVPVRVAPEDRATYHAAASIASNYLITLQAAAEQLAAAAGLERRQLAPLVRATLENWLEHGSAALTGPVARGDEETVARQRDAVAKHTPDLTELFDALTAATRELAEANRVVAVGESSESRR
jgi:predicted short-subunit dehydrogenase-like oxidoreductase (DUF2520 family)